MDPRLKQSVKTEIFFPLVSWVTPEAPVVVPAYIASTAVPSQATWAVKAQALHSSELLD